MFSIIFLAIVLYAILRYVGSASTKDSRKSDRVCSYRGCDRKTSRKHHKFCWEHYNGVVKGEYKVESNSLWAKGDIGISEFYTYVLRFEDDEFYIGHTKCLDNRLSKHYRTKVPSMEGQQPKLVWFTKFPSRSEAAVFEAKLKKLKDVNRKEFLSIINQRAI